MDFSELKIGTKLILKLSDNSGEKLGKSLVSEFEWPIGEKKAVIAAPILEGEIYPIRLNTEMDVHFSMKTNNEVNMYYFKAKVIGREVIDRISVLKIEHNGIIEKIQRRGYYRFDCSLPIQFRVVDTSDSPESAEEGYKNGRTRDLSGGGMCLLLEEIIAAGSNLECIIDEPNLKIKFFGQLVKCEKNGMATKFKYQAGVIFSKINDKDRESVVKYIFEEQRKLRKKGLM